MHEILVGQFFSAAVTLGSLNYAQEQFTCSGFAEHVTRGKARDSARSAAVIWGMNGFINQLIGCEISFKRNFCLGRNLLHILFHVFKNNRIVLEESSTFYSLSYNHTRVKGFVIHCPVVQAST